MTKTILITGWEKSGKKSLSSLLQKKYPHYQFETRMGTTLLATDLEQGFDLILVIYDGTNQKSYLDARELAPIWASRYPQKSLYLVANFIDSYDEPTYPNIYAEKKPKPKSLSYPVIYLSCKNQFGIDELWKTLEQI